MIETHFTETNSSKKLRFVYLKGLKFGNYTIEYFRNSIYLNQELSNITEPNQLLFKKFQNKNQHLNLVYIDSIFPEILAASASETCINRTYKANEIIERLSSKNPFYHKEYLMYKFNSFFESILCGNISLTEAWNGNTVTNRIFVIKNSEGLKYFSIYERHLLLDYCQKNIEFKINTKKSTFLRRKVLLNLEIAFSAYNTSLY